MTTGDQSSETTVLEQLKFIYQTHPISRIPCLYQSIVYGNGLGIAVGLGTLLYTSRPRMSTYVTLFTAPFLTVACFAGCRRKNEKSRERVTLAFEIKAYFEGTEDEFKVTDAFKSENYALVRNMLAEKKARMITGMIIDQKDQKDNRILAHK
ncbi:hypothetical protein ACOME3_007619 [Neoechinorhynchus agilis]